MDQDRAKLALEFITKHFALVSAVAVVTAFLCAIFFLYSYLLMFDWRLIWVMERQGTKSRREVVGERCRRGAVPQRAMGI